MGGGSDPYHDPIVWTHYNLTGFHTANSPTFVKTHRRLTPWALNRDAVALRWHCIYCRTEECELYPCGLLTSDCKVKHTYSHQSCDSFTVKNSHWYKSSQHQSQANMYTDRSLHLPFTTSPLFPPLGFNGVKRFKGFRLNMAIKTVSPGRRSHEKWQT